MDYLLWLAPFIIITLFAVVLILIGSY